MLGRGLAGLAIALLIGAAVVAEETRGTITKISDKSITIRTGFGFGGGFGGKGKGGKSEEKTFKISKNVKIVRVGGKDKDDVKLTLSELKTAVKVTSIFVTVTHDDGTGSEIKIGGARFGGGFGKGFGKGKGKKKKDDD